MQLASRARRLGLIVAVIAAAVPLTTRSAAAQPVALRVMTLNILYGGDEIDLDTGTWCADPRGCHEALRQIVRTIRAADADVVGLQEPINNTRWIADRLGWYANIRNHVISRYRLIDPPRGNGTYVYVELAPGEVVAVANVHLTSTPYSPYMVRNGQPRDRIIRVEERYRLPEIRRHLRALPRLADRGMPVFFTGDFNSPSHLDWTQAVADVRNVVRYPVRWPVAKALADVGFRDSYRDIYPDPVARPGFTWTPGVPRLREKEVHDRIDWVLAAGPSTTVSSEIVGETGGPDVDIDIDPYVTDHRGVVSGFTVTPARPPAFAAALRRLVARGTDLGVAFRVPQPTGWRIAIVLAGGDPRDVLRSVGTRGSRFGRVQLGTGGLSKGAHEVVLLGPNRHIRTRSEFWIVGAAGRHRVWTFDRAYEQGERIDVGWLGAPGNKYDWLGIFKPAEQEPLAAVCDAGYCGNWRYLWYTYTHADVGGTTHFDGHSSVGYGEWPLRRGLYEIRMFADDGYRLLAVSKPFRVIKAT